MKKIIVSLLIFISVQAFATDQNIPSQAYNGSGAYINVNTGYGYLQNLPTGSFAFGANAGYNFNRGFALEGGWTNLISSQYSATVYNNFYDIAVKGTLPFNDVFALYGRLGGGINYSNWTGTAVGATNCFCQNNNMVNFAALAGIGVSFALSHHFDLRLEDYMIIPMGGGNATYGNINILTGGVQYNF